MLQSPRNEGSDRWLLLAAGRARRQLLPLCIKEVSCAHGAQCQHPQHSQVHDLLASDRSIGHAREVAGEEAREWGGGAGPGVLKNESFVLELDKDDLVGVGGRLEGLPISSSVKSLTLPKEHRHLQSVLRRHLCIERSPLWARSHEWVDTLRVLTQECDRCKHGARASGWAAAVCAARQTTAKPAGGRKAGVRDAKAGKIMHLKNSGPAHRALRDPLGQHELGNRAPWRPNVEPTWA